MTHLPKFTLESYSDLLRELTATGAKFQPISRMGQASAKDVFLRHDLDFSLELALPMARVEHSLGISSTYFVLMSGPYNACSARSISAMHELVSMGHNLGLHYDLSLYPENMQAAQGRLTREIEFLQELAGTPIESIVMHEPFRGHQDFFIDNDCWINPSLYQKQDPQLLYISDSCRAWRDDSLLRYIAGDTEKTHLLLNTHPESWLSEISQHRLTYLNETLLPKMLEPIQQYFAGVVNEVWSTHTGPVNGYGDENE